MARQPSRPGLVRPRAGLCAVAVTLALAATGCESLPCPNGTAEVVFEGADFVARWCVDAARVRQGPYLRTCEDGTPQVVGQYRDDEMVGTWTEWTRVSCSTAPASVPETLEVTFSR